LNIVILGTGYVGLTTGLALSYLGNRVQCIDKNERIIEMLSNGDVTIHEPGLKEMLEKCKYKISFYHNLPLDAAEADIFFIAVGTPSCKNGQADISYVESAARAIGKILISGSSPVIIIKSTVPVGTVRRVQMIIQEELKARRIDCDFALGSNPEFLREGMALYDTFYPDRVVLGTEHPKAIDVIQSCYKPILKQAFEPPEGIPRPEKILPPSLIITNPTSAELAKYAANAFLAMKISFANEFSSLAELTGADITEVMKIVGMDRRIGPRYLGVGLGWGGSCLGKDTSTTLNLAKSYELRMPLVEAAREVNYRQRMIVINKLQQALKVLNGRIIVILGLSFKPDTDDLRDSPSYDIIRHLLELGSWVRAYDPVAVPKAKMEWLNLPVEYGCSVEEVTVGADALVIVTDWDEFKHLSLDKLARVMRTRVLVDGRNMLEPEKVRQFGFIYYGIGR